MAVAQFQGMQFKVDGEMGDGSSVLVHYLNVMLVQSYAIGADGWPTLTQHRVNTCTFHYFKLLIVLCSTVCKRIKTTAAVKMRMLSNSGSAIVVFYLIIWFCFLQKIKPSVSSVCGWRGGNQPLLLYYSIKGPSYTI